MNGPRPLEGLSDIAPYVPGKGARMAGTHKLSANESALGASAAAIRAFRDASEYIHRYPDGDASALRAAIGEVHGLDPAQLIIGAGSDEIISLLIRAYAEPGSNIVQSEHGFSYYAIAAQALRVGTKWGAEVALHTDPDQILSAVDEDTRLVFVANPNNPTGTMVGIDVMRDLRARLRPDVLLVVDGAYAEYADGLPGFADGRAMVDDSISSGVNNVVMLRTFSKVYGLGGLRVGWAYGPPAIIDILGRIRPPFNVATPALAAAEAAIRDQEFVAENRAYTEDARAQIARALVSMGFAVTEGVGNFVLFRAPGETATDRTAAARSLIGFLETRGVLIRSAASSHLPDYLRVTIGLPDANAAFLGGVAAWIAERG